MKRVLFIDRDGTLIVEPPDQQVDDWSKLRFCPGAITFLGRIARELEFELVMVTNQDGLGTAAFPEERFWPIHNFILETLAGEGIRFREVLIDRSLPTEGRETRKPGLGLVQHYLLGEYDLAHSFVIGDRITDVQFARNLGCGAIYLGTDPSPLPVSLHARDWASVYRFLRGRDRQISLERRTRETQVRLQLNPDGDGHCRSHTGLGFFDHMLAQLARHARMDLEIQVQGDLEVDEHHTIEDTALALGEALRSAVGFKKGMHRYGFVLPMDDALARVALDFSGRPWLVWKADFRREKIGQVPTEMFSHFFKSLSDAAGLTLHVKAEGENEHHKIEAIFKAVGRALGQALQRTEGDGRIPSTKGRL
ncbi:MAG: bifunctional histidinol-phosphatase/imidazoleglycerol-phosphate dehydratase HisB [Calditrichaeota bacterium]|nr:MAG: bifunctional histidinol-phosphatase/imidazoleglycerol-phosphate dehydratase HisB [Calditrichota bacterium]